MVTVPLLLGVWLAGPQLLHLPLAIAWYSGYFAFFDVSWWLRARGKRKRDYIPALATYGSLCALAAIVVIVAQPRVLWWAAVFGPLIAIAVYEAYRRRPRSLASGISTVLASAAMTSLASFVVGTPMTELTLRATALLALYFVGTIFYVKSLIRERRNPKFSQLSALVHAVFCACAFCLSPWAGLVFVALTVRAWLMPWLGRKRDKPWTPKFVGMTEMLSTALVVVTAVI